MIRLALSELQGLRWPEPASWLAEGEHRRLAGFTGARRRQVFLANRWLLRELLARYGTGEPSEQSVDVDSQGRSLRSCGHANVSHSGDWLLAATADTPLGVDLEQLRPRKTLMRLAQQVHSPEQCATLVALDGEARLQQFYRWWTLKEAWFKARGQGLDLARMRELEFVPCAADEGDACSGLLPQAGLAVAIQCSQLRGTALPCMLADEPVDWQFLCSSPTRSSVVAALGGREA